MAPPIDLIDDFLDKALYEEILAMSERGSMWYGWKSHDRNDPHGHWVAVLSKSGRDNKVDATPNLVDQFRPVWDNVREIVANKCLVTAYISGHTYGTEGYFHTDSAEQSYTTALLYLVRGDWDPDWGGETVFIDDQNQIQASIFPKANRLVVFPSNIRHCARGVTRKFTGLRRTLIFKTRRDFD